MTKEKKPRAPMKSRAPVMPTNPNVVSGWPAIGAQFGRSDRAAYAMWKRGELPCVFILGGVATATKRGIDEMLRQLEVQAMGTAGAADLYQPATDAE